MSRTRCIQNTTFGLIQRNTVPIVSNEEQCEQKTFNFCLNEKTKKKTSSYYFSERISYIFLLEYDVILWEWWLHTLIPFGTTFHSYAAASGDYFVNGLIYRFEYFVAKLSNYYQSFWWIPVSHRWSRRASPCVCHCTHSRIIPSIVKPLNLHEVLSHSPFPN